MQSLGLLLVLCLSLQIAVQSFIVPLAAPRPRFRMSTVDHDLSTAAVEHLPRAPLPPIIMPNVPGTWAYDTMSRRVREEIVARIFKVSTQCNMFSWQGSTPH
eukprot:20143-Heterococcus_DN1.PRE.2